MRIRTRGSLILGISALAMQLSVISFGAASKAAAKPPATTTTAAKAQTETAILAGGCFWGVEEFFRKIPGVTATRVGFTGGTTPNPKYDDTHDGHTGHAESVEIKFDPKKVTYEFLLDQFFKMHDPTTKDRQLNDTGTQYRSAVFYTTDEQKKVAEAFKAKVEASGAWKAPIMTEITKASVFYESEPEHQKYLVQHPGGYDNHRLRNISFGKKSGK